MRSALGLILAIAAQLLMVDVRGAIAGRNVALVIGNSTYQNVNQLPNPVNDAAAVAALLKQTGFEVVESRQNLGTADTRRALRDFSDRVADADIALVYFAGHGIEVDGINYLIPVDAKLERDTDVQDEAVSLDRVLQMVEPARRLRLVILDACRDNPFTRSIKRTVATRSIGRGLARVEPISTDTLVAFAAKAGSFAEDGSGRNSPFTTALLKHIATPGLDLRLALGRVRDEVLKDTGNKQEPFVYGSLGGDTVALVPAVPTGNATAARLSYELAAQIGSKQAWQSFLAVSPRGRYADLARRHVERLELAEQTVTKAVESQKASEDRVRTLTREPSKRSEVDQATKDLEEAQQKTEDAKRQVDELKRQVIDEARTLVEEPLPPLAPTVSAALNSTAVPAASNLDPSDLARLLQTHLQRVGCEPGSSDGNWSNSSKKAMEQFNKNANTKLKIEAPTVAALDTVRAKPGRVCPLVCSTGQRIEGDRCVRITCESGFKLAANGTCVKQPVPRQNSVARQAPSAPSQPASGHPKCFNFNGKRFCE